MQTTAQTSPMTATRIAGNLYTVRDGASSSTVSGHRLVEWIQRDGRPCDVDARMARGEGEPGRFTVRPEHASISEAMDAAGPTGPHRCCSPRCPGRPYKASDYRHPAPC